MHSTTIQYIHTAIQYNASHHCHTIQCNALLPYNTMHCTIAIQYNAMHYCYTIQCIVILPYNTMPPRAPQGPPNWSLQQTGPLGLVPGRPEAACFNTSMLFRADDQCTAVQCSALQCSEVQYSVNVCLQWTVVLTHHPGKCHKPLFLVKQTHIGRGLPGHNMQWTYTHQSAHRLEQSCPRSW